MILHSLRNQWTVGFDTGMFWTNCEHSFKTEMIHNDSAVHPTWFSFSFGWWCTNYGVVICRDVFFDRKPEAEGMVTKTDCKRRGLSDYHCLGHNTRPAGCWHSAGCDWPPLTCRLSSPARHQLREIQSLTSNNKLMHGATPLIWENTSPPLPLFHFWQNWHNKFDYWSS